MSALQIANSAPMWIACGIAVLVVIAQSVLFLTRAYAAGPKVGLTDKQMKELTKNMSKKELKEFKKQQERAKEDEFLDMFAFFEAMRDD